MAVNWRDEIEESKDVMMGTGGEMGRRSFLHRK